MCEPGLCTSENTLFMVSEEAGPRSHSIPTQVSCLTHHSFQCTHETYPLPTSIPCSQLAFQFPEMNLHSSATSVKDTGTSGPTSRHTSIPGLSRMDSEELRERSGLGALSDAGQSDAATYSYAPAEVLAPELPGGVSGCVRGWMMWDTGMMWSLLRGLPSCEHRRESAVHALKRDLCCILACHLHCKTVLLVHPAAPVMAQQLPQYGNSKLVCT